MKEAYNNYHNKIVGKNGEDIACSFLISNDYQLLSRNYKTKIGEIDIIAKKNNDIVFIEVKTRKSLNYGFPSEAVNHTKARKILTVSSQYLNEYLEEYNSIRYDVIEVYLIKNWIRVNHIKNVLF